MNAHRLAVALVTLLPALPAAAQEPSPVLRMSVACAPVGTPTPSKPLRISVRAPAKRTVLNAGDHVAIDGGRKAGIEAGQRYFVRRPMTFHGAPRAEHTAGWLRIVDSSESTATAQIEFACDGVAVGDHLEPYVEPTLPPGVERTDATGTLDFSRTATVLYGTDGRETGGGSDFMLARMTEGPAVVPGARYAVYRGRNPGGDPRAAFAEAVVVSVFAEQSLLRITQAGDAVTVGDTLVLRAGGAGDRADEAAARAAPAVDDNAGLASETIREPAADPEEPRGSRPTDRTSPASSRRMVFEDIYFDFNRSTLRPEVQSLLDGALKALRDDPALRLQIEGHTCNIGSHAHNLALGERRARAVRDYLVEHGIAEQRLTTLTHGETQPKYDNDRKDTRRKNRRAVLAVGGQP